MSTNKRIIAAIMLALVVWGIYLAVGSTGYFLQESLFDARKSFIVAVCSTSFLAMWVFVLHAVEKRTRLLSQQSDNGTDSAIDPAEEISEKTAWSKAALVTLGIGGFGLLVWAFAASSWGSVSLTTTTGLGWLAAVSMVGAATSGMVALSNPRALRGKWLGFLGLLLCAGAIVGFVVRMSP